MSPTRSSHPSVGAPMTRPLPSSSPSASATGSRWPSSSSQARVPRAGCSPWPLPWSGQRPCGQTMGDVLIRSPVQPCRAAGTDGHAGPRPAALRCLDRRLERRRHPLRGRRRGSPSRRRCWGAPAGRRRAGSSARLTQTLGDDLHGTRSAGSRMRGWTVEESPQTAFGKIQTLCSASATSPSSLAEPRGAQVHTTGTSVTASATPLSRAVLGAPVSTSTPAPSRVPALTRISPAAASTPTRAATCTPCPR
jgi:hypothetical protein